MTHVQFTTDDYLRAIERELRKRTTTYPKILAKMKKRNQPDDVEAAMEFDNEVVKQYTQIRRLKNVGYLVQTAPIGGIGNAFAEGCLFELMRELKERKRCYPRWVKVYKMMTQETADYELAVWESLTRWFAKEYLDLDEFPTKRKKKK